MKKDRCREKLPSWPTLAYSTVAALLLIMGADRVAAGDPPVPEKSEMDSSSKTVDIEVFVPVDPGSACDTKLVRSTATINDGYTDSSAPPSTTLEDQKTDYSQSGDPETNIPPVHGMYSHVPPIGSKPNVQLPPPKKSHSIKGGGKPFDYANANRMYTRAREILSLSSQIFDEGYRKSLTKIPPMQYTSCPVHIKVVVPRTYSFDLCSAAKCPEPEDRSWIIPARDHLVFRIETWKTASNPDDLVNEKEKLYAEAFDILALSERLYLQSLP